MTETRATPMLELYQREGCHECARVRRALADLKLDYMTRQVPADPGSRHALEGVTGQREVPVLLDHGGGLVVTEADDIIAYLHETYDSRNAAP